MEYCSRAATIVGERFWIYAAKKKGAVGRGPLPVWSGDLAVAWPPGRAGKLRKPKGRRSRCGLSRFEGAAASGGRSAFLTLSFASLD